MKIKNKNLYQISFIKENQKESNHQLPITEEELIDYKIVEEQIHAYIEGKRKKFCLNHYLKWLLDEEEADKYPHQGTDFQKKVWRTLLTIPYGSCCSYSDVAQEFGQPNSFRAVANAIGENPLLMVIPCHRVIRKNGELGGFSAGLDIKERLLILEKRAVSSF
ncbi:MAG: methylated-DNA--[protein]-cysteine S-methyltransferase [Thermotogota bacterium]